MSPTMIAVNCLIVIASMLFNTVSALPISNSRVERGVDKIELLQDGVVSSMIAQQIVSSQKLGIQVPVSKNSDDDQEVDEINDMIKNISQFYKMKDELDSRAKNTTAEGEEATQFKVLSGMMELVINNTCNYLMDKMDDDEFECTANQVHLLVAKMKILEITENAEAAFRAEEKELYGRSYFNQCDWVVKYIGGSSSVESLRQFMKKNYLYIHCPGF